MGDGIEDLGMIEGFDAENLLKIGFYNDESEGDINDYKRSFDMLITKDSDMGSVNRLLRNLFA